MGNSFVLGFAAMLRRFVYPRNAADDGVRVLASDAAGSEAWVALLTGDRTIVERFNGSSFVPVAGAGLRLYREAGPRAVGAFQRDRRSAAQSLRRPGLGRRTAAAERKQVTGKSSIE